jgi:hypothetical protein
MAGLQALMPFALSCVLLGSRHAHAHEFWHHGNRHSHQYGLHCRVRDLGTQIMQAPNGQQQCSRSSSKNTDLEPAVDGMLPHLNPAPPCTQASQPAHCCFANGPADMMWGPAGSRN